MSRASCCKISDTPQVTSKVSSGRWYIRRIKVASRITPSSPPTTNPIGIATSREIPAFADHLLHHVRRVGPGHDELAVGHVDHAHLAEGQGQAERDQQQDGTLRHPGEQLPDDDIHAISF